MNSGRSHAKSSVSISARPGWLAFHLFSSADPNATGHLAATRATIMQYVPSRGSSPYAPQAFQDSAISVASKTSAPPIFSRPSSMSSFPAVQAANLPPGYPPTLTNSRLGAAPASVATSTPPGPPKYPLHNSIGHSKAPASHRYTYSEGTAPHPTASAVQQDLPKPGIARFITQEQTRPVAPRSGTGIDAHGAPAASQVVRPLDKYVAYAKPVVKFGQSYRERSLTSDYK